MSLTLRVCALSIAGVLSLTSAAFAQGAAPFSAPDVRIARSSSGTALTPTSRAATIEIVRGYLRAQGHGQATVDSLALVSEGRSPRTGVTHARFVQRVQGLDVYGVYVKASVDASGQLTSIIENLVPVRSLDTLVGRENLALASALRHLYRGAVAPPGLSKREGNTAIFDRTPFFYRGPRVTQVAVPFGAGLLRAGYVVETWSADGNLLHHTLVGGDGASRRRAAHEHATRTMSSRRTRGHAAEQSLVPAPAQQRRVAQGWLGLGRADLDQHQGQQRARLSGHRRQQRAGRRRHRGHRRRTS